MSKKPPNPQRPTPDVGGSPGHPAFQSPQPKLLRRRRLASYHFFPALSPPEVCDPPSLADSGFVKGLNFRRWVESNRAL